MLGKWVVQGTAPVRSQLAGLGKASEHRDIGRTLAAHPQVVDID